MAATPISTCFCPEVENLTSKSTGNDLKVLVSLVISSLVLSFVKMVLNMQSSMVQKKELCQKLEEIQQVAGSFTHPAGLQRT
jgi:hypothetical protein